MATNEQPPRSEDAPADPPALQAPEPIAEVVRRADFEEFPYWQADAARSGDTEAARDILSDFVGAIDARSEKVWPHIGPPIHWAHARYLADAFQKILDGADPAVGLGIKSSKPGRRKGARTYDEEALAAAYWFLIRRGFQAERVVKDLQKRVGADRRTIQRASVASGNSAFKYPQLIDDEVLKNVFKPYAAIIKAILAADPKQRR